MLLARPGACYVAYLPRGGAASLTLAPGTYSARWYDPRGGSFRNAGQVVADGRWTSEPAPDAEDWVLLIEATKSATAR
jgi:hypothetical protein